MAASHDKLILNTVVVWEVVEGEGSATSKKPGFPAFQRLSALNNTNWFHTMQDRK